MVTKMPTRKVLYASNVYANLRRNEKFKFSSAYLLSIYGLNAVCTYIPKNACSSLRFSVAMSNGYVSSISDVGWIHNNNDAFVATKREAATADYAFVILRCPYRRAVSAFLDKIVGGEIYRLQSSQRERVEHKKGLISHTVKGANLFRTHRKESLKRKLEAMSFRSFIEEIADQPAEKKDHHWRNQSDFLMFNEYDDYFCVEDINGAIDTLKSRGFDLVDTRPALRHDTSFQRETVEVSADTTVANLRALKLLKRLPGPAALYDGELYDLVSEVFADDIALYQTKVNTGSLLPRPNH